MDRPTSSPTTSGRPSTWCGARSRPRWPTHARVEAWVRPDDASGPAGRDLVRPAPRGRDARRHRRRRPSTGSSTPGSPTTPRCTSPEGFRALLNSFLPRKRAISQMLVRDQDDRVLLCRLTYKQDWDLPGGVVEVGESPQLAVAREVEEELGARDPGRPPAAHRLAAAVERLGRRALPGLRRRRARRLARRRRSSARSARSATPSSARSTRCARALRRLHRPPGRGRARQPRRRRAGVHRVGAVARGRCGLSEGAARVRGHG